MTRIISLTIIFICLLLNKSLSETNIFIYASIDNEVITNHDIKKESLYLKILNPNLEQINEDKILDLAKVSLINEIIKKKEILKFIDLNQENPFVDDYLKNLYEKLNYVNEEQFSEALKKGNNYSLDQIKQKIRIELFWNELIYSKYKNQIKIDKKKLIKKINNLTNKTRKQYLLSEIVFNKKKGETLEKLIEQIKLSINEIGFNNTANIYSVSESSKFGGKLGWVNESSLSRKILNELKSIKESEYTQVIQIGKNYLILKIDQIKTDEIKIDKQKELEKLIQIETNKQLNQFSRIYFDKSKINYSINEK